jgi:hypothetical protein
MLVLVALKRVQPGIASTMNTASTPLAASGGSSSHGSAASACTASLFNVSPVGGSSNVHLNRPTHLTLGITNAGTITCTITGTSATLGPFQTSAFSPLSLAPGQGQTLNVDYDGGGTKNQSYEVPIATVDDDGSAIIVQLHVRP